MGTNSALCPLPTWHHIILREKPLKIAQTLVAAAALAACTGALAAPILWISDGGGQLGTVDVATGTSSLVGNMGQAMFDIAFDSLGNLWGISGGGAQLYSINSSTAVATLVGSTGTAFTNSLVFGPGGVLYAAGSSLYSLNTSTGAGTLIGNGNGYASSGDLAFVGGNLYLSSNPTANDSLWDIDETTGQGVNIGAIGFGSVFGLATPDNVTLYGLSGQTVLSINTATGLGSFVTNYSGGGMTGAFGTAFRTEAGAPIPEPSALSLVALALLGLGWASKRQKS